MMGALRAGIRRTTNRPPGIAVCFAPYRSPIRAGPQHCSSRRLGATVSSWSCFRRTPRKQRQLPSCLNLLFICSGSQLGGILVSDLRLICRHSLTYIAAIPIIFQNCSATCFAEAGRLVYIAVGTRVGNKKATNDIKKLSSYILVSNTLTLNGKAGRTGILTDPTKNGSPLPHRGERFQPQLKRFEYTIAPTILASRSTSAAVAYTWPV